MRDDQSTFTQCLELEANNLREDAKWSAACQFARSTIWRIWYNVLTTVVGGLAAITGVAVLTKVAGITVAGISSLVVAAITGIQTVLSPDAKAKAAANAANQYLVIRDELRHFVRLDIGRLPSVEARERLKELTGRVHEINMGIDPPGNWAWRVARRRSHQVDGLSSGDGITSS